jgi:17beta-estradiol 17-dehydrogenase / very-long-chain 3-oxoacyl-CoA reductase
MFHRHRTISDYLHQQTEPAWALVTGASDGIGLGFTQELSSNGFNVILHGRNSDKLKRVQDNLQAQFPAREYKIFVHDAEKELTADILHNLVKSFEEVNLTILINNVGGAGSVTPSWLSFVEHSAEDIDKYININIRFPTQITRALLSHLIKNAPGLILNISSFTALYPSPWLGVYAGSKAFNLAWSASLKAEMRAEEKDIDLLGIVIAKAQSATVRQETRFFTPSSREIAKKALDEVGCGKKWVTPVWAHALQQWFLDWLPQGLLESVVIWAASAEKARSERKQAVER